MRDILLSTTTSTAAPVATPWSTYVPATPISRRAALSVIHETPSPSPVKCSSEHSSEVRSSLDTTDPDFPHFAEQLPTRLGGNMLRDYVLHDPKAVFERFMHHLPDESRARIRQSYNGPDWPQYRPRLSAARINEVSENRQSLGTTATPPLYYVPPPNVFAPVTAYTVPKFQYFTPRPFRGQ
jgi:hypothetical protein